MRAGLIGDGTGRARPGGSGGAERLYDDGLPYALGSAAEDYSSFGDSFYVEVDVTPVEGRLIWINRSWFASQGADLDDPGVGATVERWLLDTFAVEVAKPGAPGRRAMRADRYGADGGTLHGGSGRCVYLGRFNGKGIGPTPLVPGGLRAHADGRLPLIEAIREAIYAELCHCETAHGAVRTIAIIAKPPFDVPPSDRDCIIVRPNFLRPAHFERSLTFGTAGAKSSDQYQDAVRVARVRERLREDGILPVIARNATQIGAMDAMRMVQGRYTSANVSISGEVADFGSFRFMNNWRYARLIADDHDVFGKDLDWLKMSAVSWVRIFRDQFATPPDLQRFVDEAHREGFEGVVRMVANLPTTARAAAGEIAGLFYAVFRRNRLNDTGELGRWPFPEEGCASTSPSLRRVADILDVQGLQRDVAQACLARISLWLLPRTDISYTSINKMIEDLIARTNPGALPRGVSAFIERLIGINRRAFGNYPSNYIPIGHCYFDGKTGLYCFDGQRQDYKILIWEQTAAIGSSEMPCVFGCPPEAVRHGCWAGVGNLRVPEAVITYNEDM